MSADSPTEENFNQEEGEQNIPETSSPEELLQKLVAAKQLSAQYWERIVRMQADTENLTRRLERDVQNAHKFALDKFVAELLPIVDSLELCIVNGNAKDPVVEGVNLTLRMFYTALEKFGIKQVNPIGKPFDPEFEQAISMQFDPNSKPNTVLSVLQKGYTLNNRLVRPALVVVAKAEE